MPKAGMRRPPTELFWAKVDRSRGPDGCWMWTGGTDPDGYGIFSETAPPGSARATLSTRAHRYAWALANGPVPSGKLLMHSCDTPTCVNPAHLSPGTPLENNRDAFAKGRRRARGEHNIKAKLTPESVLEIRASRDSADELATRYRISAGTVYAIRRGITWRHLDTSEVAEGTT